MRDSKIYDAENRVFADEQKLSEIGVKKFFYQIVGDSWFINKYGEGYKLYIVGNYYDYSFAIYKQIYILEYEHFTEASVIHEICHSVKHVRGNPHGKAWQKRYIEMVGRYISIEKAEQLAEEFAKLT